MANYEDLIKILNEATAAKKAGKKPAISDKDWNDIYALAQAVEKQTGVVSPDSPTNTLPKESADDTVENITTPESEVIEETIIPEPEVIAEPVIENTIEQVVENTKVDVEEKEECLPTESKKPAAAKTTTKKATTKTPTKKAKK